jgi:competence protein ComEA
MEHVPVLPVSRRQALVAAAVLVAILFLAGKLLLRGGSGTEAKRSEPAVVSAVRTPRPKLVVHVVGAVRRPGLYRFQQGSRISDAVRRAGGSTAKADLERLNLAAPIADGQQVVVPREAPVAATSPAGAEAAPTGPVSLSTATVADLDELPGVGPVTAQRILAYRTEHGAFRSVDELDAIPGIGPARLDQLRDLVVP